MSENITAIIAIIGLLPLYYDLIQRWRSGRLSLTLLRFQEIAHEPIESSWSIRIFKPTKAIEKCKILYGDTPLPWYGSDKPSYEEYVQQGKTARVLLPKDAEKNNKEIVVMDGNRVKKRIRWNDIPLAPH